MPYKIGVFGSAINASPQIMRQASMLGELLGEKHFTIVTGGCDGLPYAVALAAYQTGAKIVGFSPMRNLPAHKRKYPKQNLKIYSKLYCISPAFNSGVAEVCRKYRNVLSTAFCDAGIIVAGRWGTLNEFTNLMDMGKVVGVLTGTGEMADELPRLVKKVNKKTQAIVCFDSSPTRLIAKISKELRKRKMKK